VGRRSLPTRRGGSHAISPDVRSGHPDLHSLDGNLTSPSRLRSVSDAAQLARETPLTLNVSRRTWKKAAAPWMRRPPPQKPSAVFGAAQAGCLSPACAGKGHGRLFPRTANCRSSQPATTPAAAASPPAAGGSCSASCIHAMARRWRNADNLLIKSKELRGRERSFGRRPGALLFRGGDWHIFHSRLRGDFRDAFTTTAAKTIGLYAYRTPRRHRHHRRPRRPATAGCAAGSRSSPENLMYQQPQADRPRPPQPSRCVWSVPAWYSVRTSPKQWRWLGVGVVHSSVHGRIGIGIDIECREFKHHRCHGPDCWSDQNRCPPLPLRYWS